MNAISHKATARATWAEQKSCSSTARQSRHMTVCVHQGVMEEEASRTMQSRTAAVCSSFDSGEHETPPQTKHTMLHCSQMHDTLDRYYLTGTEPGARGWCRWGEGPTPEYPKHAHSVDCGGCLPCCATVARLHQMSTCASASEQSCHTHQRDHTPTHC